ncbi:YopX family protein [Liquorilactobacillus uvarum]|uniref:YopX protein domain-containing protein n=1 Tax=Liquorilactobacillus uvarum DSM 19971 TaxID=1423812 RepID=A0A0R1Q2U0_9LACO|nr:YopX family protein [Liquorilactobacillus uvarum]KRL38764.1 hypothetical protein FD20_GL000831 [Liquorilactobacillus uvarum DSM 19971]
MNREIEFRGVPSITKDEIEYADIPLKNGIVYGNYSDGCILGPVIEVTDEYIAHKWWCSIVDGTLEQYIGLKDKNGNKIYEGNIIKSTESTGAWTTRSKLYEVIFNRSSAQFQLQDLKDKRCLYSFFGGGPGSNILEVIGDIHNNPELLEAGK